ncbi:MAG: hypothetical protein IJY12_05405 [Clostridia bacterium]|nr:hypothetical protein [Clostridia bacterium]
MKICPTCKMTVDAEAECPICGTTVTYEPKAPAEREKYVFNRYLVWYLFKHCWFSLLCFGVVLVRWILRSPQIDPYFFMILFLLAASLAFGVFERKIRQALLWKYSERYAAFTATFTKLISGAIAVVFAFVMW